MGDVSIQHAEGFRELLEPGAIRTLFQPIAPPQAGDFQVGDAP